MKTAKKKYGTGFAKAPQDPEGQHDLVWDTSQAASDRADEFGIAAGREEIALKFGTAVSRDHRNLHIRGVQRVVLSPFVAKRLAILLRRVIADHEVRFGPQAPPAGPAEKVRLNSALLPSACRTKIADREAELLFQHINGLDTVVGFERSVKVLERTLLANRFLAGFKKSTVRGNAQERILDVCRAIHMPAEYLEDFREGLPETNIVLFGFEEHKDSRVYKAYLEFGDRFDKVTRPDPFVVHMGYKWDTVDKGRKSVTRYACLPLITVEGILERLSFIFYGDSHKTPLKIAAGILAHASQVIDHYEILYLEAKDDNNPRQSFDINIYRANIRMAAFYPLLSKMCRHYSISLTEFDRLYGPVQDQIFGHLSGGVDKAGRDFLTFYFGVKGSSHLTLHAGEQE